MYIYVYISGFTESLICVNFALDKLFSTEQRALAQTEILHNDKFRCVYVSDPHIFTSLLKDSAKTAVHT